MQPKRKPPQTPKELSGKKNFDTIWTNCGNTAQYLIGRVHDAGGDVDRDLRKGESWDRWGQATFTAKTTKEILELLLNDVKQVTLINITIDGMHEFIIEKHPDGSAVLQQGYQVDKVGSYSAFWWGDVGDPEDKRMVAHKGEKVNARRDIFGKGKAFSSKELGKLAEGLVTFLTATPHTIESRNAWDELPFLPGGWEEKEDYKLLAAVWTVNEPETVLKKLSETGEKEHITTAVLKEAWANRNN